MTKFPIPDVALAQHIAVLGKTGSGKTSTAKLAVEHVVKKGAGARVCILDPIKSDWWGLTSSVNGEKAGLPFHILGGPRGHVSLHASAGKAVGEIVASGELPLSIIDMANFNPGGQAQFFVDFAPTLIRKMRGVVYLVIEEAHLFAPKERSGIGAENMSIHWAKMLATAGRSKGIRLILVTQRTQALHNALLGSCDTMIAHRLTAPADQEPVVKWLKANTDKATTEKVAGSLSSLSTGSAWLCSGEAKVFELVRFPRITTYDNTATPTGDGDNREIKTAPVDQERLRAIIGTAVKEAEANDPRVLKAELAKANAEITKLRKAPVQTSQPVEKIDTPAIEAEIAKARAELQGRVTAFQAAVADAEHAIAAMLPEIRQAVTNAEAVIADHMRNLKKALPAATVENLAKYSRPIPAACTNPVPNYAPNYAKSKQAPRPSRSATGTGDIRLPPGETAVLIAAAQFDGVEREQLTILTGYKRSSRDAYIQRLREKGFVEVSGSTVSLTDAGATALPADYEPLPTGTDLQEYWLSRLPEGEKRILQELINAYPKSVARSDLDAATGYQRSSRDAYLQRMKAKRLWKKDGAAVRASEVLFQ